MSIRQKRLDKGWTQSQLAEFCGLSLRTIQRVEKGQKPTLETQKALAAVFETEVSEIVVNHDIDESLLSEDEAKELEYIREKRSFFNHLITYLIVAPFLTLVNWNFGLAIGWGAWLVYKALKLFDAKELFGAGWEKRELEKRIGRKVK